VTTRSRDTYALDLGIEPPWTNVSYVGAVCAALRARGAECDCIGMAGFSGYAFVVNVAPGLVPDAVTAFDWMMLNEGAGAFGVAVETDTVDCEMGSGERPRLLVELFERVCEEVGRGSPCVVWGVGTPPGFAVVYGWDRDSYLVRSRLSAAGEVGRGLPTSAVRPLGPAERPEPPVRFDSLVDTGRLGAVFFGEDQPVGSRRMEQRAVERAGQLLAGEHACFEPGNVSGWPAFEAWADELVGGRYQPFGNSYTLRCLTELQLFAAGFCRRLSQARPDAARPLSAASAGLSRSADRLEALQELFPCPGDDTRPGPTVLQAAARSLRACAADNREALAALRDAAALL